MSLESVQLIQSEWGHVSKWLDKIKTEDEYQSHLKDLETLTDEVGDNLKHPLSEFLDLLPCGLRNMKNAISPSKMH